MPKLKLYLLLFLSSFSAIAQTPVQRFVTQKGDLYGLKKIFIQNVGQYDVIDQHFRTGKILYGYEGFGAAVVFTPQGLVHLQRKYSQPEQLTGEERELLEAAEEAEEEDGEPWLVTERTVHMKWMDANPNPRVVAEGMQAHHFVYNLLQKKAGAFKRIVYKELYPGIDLVYSFPEGSQTGFEYSLLVQPGADLSMVKLAYTGDVKGVRLDRKGQLEVDSEIDGIRVSAPKAFYQNSGAPVAVQFKLTGQTLSFYFPKGYDRSQALVIDPFISTTSTLTGENAGIAKDIDFDYNGNIYVSGGGSNNVYMLAKYDGNGVLQWTFNGGPVSAGTSSWTFGLNYGGFVVEKNSGKIYLGQGWSLSGGVQVLRLNAAGVYDNYITDKNPVFTEGWRLIWDCNSGNAQMLVAGGGNTSPLDFGVFSPPSTTMSTQNITGILTNHSQDIADAIIDPRTHEMYTIFASGHIPPNNMYKHGAPYNATNILWNKSSGLNVLFERRNRPYLVPMSGNDNSINAFAINTQALFYWDGKNLKAFNKSTGDVLGTPLVTADTVLCQGGIIADECGNVFVGSQHGTIKVYKFDGTSFNDNAAPDITITGFTGYNSVYDLAYDDARRLLYVSGRGFVASVDVNAYCAQATYQVQIAKNCHTNTATASLSPAPPAGSTVSYILYNGTTQVSSNNSGVFAGLSPGVNYTVKVLINQDCSGVQTMADFGMGGPAVNISKTDACGSNGSITVNVGAGGTAPYEYSIGGGFQSSNSFTGLAPGNYPVSVRDAAGCVTDVPVVVHAGSNCVTATVSVVHETCSQNNGSITVNASNGTTPYSYSIDGSNFVSSPVFSNLPAGNYTVTVTDASGGVFMVNALVQSINSSNLGFTYTTTTGSCAGNDASLSVSGTGGTAPLQYSIDGTNYQASGSFLNISGGNYTVTVKDANGCMSSQQVSVPFVNDLELNAGSDEEICEGASVVLNPVSNAASFSWSPAGGLSNPAIRNPVASPSVTTLYQVTGRKGPCTVTDEVLVEVKPAPVPFAGADTSICYGQSLQLQGSGGMSYSWSPSTYLTSTNIADPVAVRPEGNIVYSLSVVGANGCASLQPDHIRVTITHPLQVFAGNDTAMLANEPLQLNAVDLNNHPDISWSWTPPAFLSNAFIHNPVFSAAQDMSYLVKAVTPEGCEDSDSLHIKIYFSSDIYVPTAFTPNGDGKNDLLRAIPVGIREFQYFRVYNRWGQLVFSTNNSTAGWDGLYGGKEQRSEVFVWIAAGIDYKGKVMERKGTVLLVR